MLKPINPRIIVNDMRETSARSDYDREIKRERENAMCYIIKIDNRKIYILYMLYIILHNINNIINYIYDYKLISCPFCKVSDLL